jgi:hypothetical protein
MNPKDRPVYGRFIPVLEDSATKRAWQYGQIVLVDEKNQCIKNIQLDCWRFIR